MPRQKTELTINPKIVGVRLTQELFMEWRKLGGGLWLRKVLAEIRKERLEKIEKLNQKENHVKH